MSFNLKARFYVEHFHLKPPTKKNEVGKANRDAKDPNATMGASLRGKTNETQAEHLWG
jgi:hypothetical protein